MFGGLGTAYSGLALFALIHLLILLGVVGYAYQTGRIDRSKIEEITAIMRGDPPGGSETWPEGAGGRLVSKRTPALDRAEVAELNLVESSPEYKSSMCGLEDW